MQTAARRGSSGPVAAVSHPWGRAVTVGWTGASAASRRWDRTVDGVGWRAAERERASSVFSRRKQSVGSALEALQVIRLNPAGNKFTI